MYLGVEYFRVPYVFRIEAAKHWAASNVAGPPRQPPMRKSAERLTGSGRSCAGDGEQRFSLAAGNGCGPAPSLGTPRPRGRLLRMRTPTDPAPCRRGREPFRRCLHACGGALFCSRCGRPGPPTVLRGLCFRTPGSRGR
jgi:hypothetical protein